MIFAIFVVICDQVWFGGDTWTHIITLMTPNWDAGGGLFGTIIGALSTFKDWLQALLTVIFLKANFWNGGYILLWYIFCVPLGVGVIVSVVVGIIHR